MVNDVIWKILAALGTLCAIIFGYATYKRNNKTDACDDGKNSGMILTELGYIKSGVDDLKAEQKDQRTQNMQFITRLTAVESSASQAHKRIDEVNKQLNDK